jgi:hypothetical protein
MSYVLAVAGQTLLRIEGFLRQYLSPGDPKMFIMDIAPTRLTRHTWSSVNSSGYDPNNERTQRSVHCGLSLTNARVIRSTWMIHSSWCSRRALQTITMSSDAVEYAALPDGAISMYYLCAQLGTCGINVPIGTGDDGGGTARTRPVMSTSHHLPRDLYLGGFWIAHIQSYSPSHDALPAGRLPV